MTARSRCAGRRRSKARCEDVTDPVRYCLCARCPDIAPGNVHPTESRACAQTCSPSVSPFVTSLGLGCRQTMSALLLDPLPEFPPRTHAVLLHADLVRSEPGGRSAESCEVGIRDAGCEERRLGDLDLEAVESASGCGRRELRLRERDHRSEKRKEESGGGEHGRSKLREERR